MSARALPIALATLLLAGCGGGGPSSTNTPDEMMAHVVGPGALANAADVQGCGDTWQGYQLWLRWTMAPAALDSLLADGWTPVADVPPRLDLPDDYDCFDPTWAPRGDAYEGTFPTDWGTGQHTLVVDRPTGTVTFYGIAP